MSDEQAVRSTVLDYYDGWFDGDPTRMDMRSIRGSRSARSSPKARSTKTRLRA